jgi:beta-lactamase regulating signal transducer with metallopeptidase domain
MSWDVSLVFKATVLLAVALGAVAVLDRMRASRRHLILAAAFVALLALPLAVPLLPAIAVPLPVTTIGVSLPDSLPTPADSAKPQPALQAHQRVQPIASTWAPSPLALLRSLWLLGSAILALGFIGSLWTLHRARRFARPWTEGQAMADALANEIDLKRTVTVAIHERATVPAAMGVLRPTILFPPDAATWATSDLQRVLIHEIEHARRRD